MGAKNSTILVVSFPCGRPGPAGTRTTASPMPYDSSPSANWNRIPWELSVEMFRVL